MRKIHLRHGADFSSPGDEINSGPFTAPWNAHPQHFPGTRQVSVAQKRLILVIDDSPTVRKIVETCLGREGFAVRSFPDGVEAIQWLSQPGICIPHLIILDIGLPKMDGYEVARRLKTNPQFHKTVIIMLSRRDGVIDRLKSRLAGAKDHITKPFKTQTIISVAETYLGIPAPL